jgi:hypothetical protein
MAKQEASKTPEEQLDRLIERWECGSWLRPVASDEIEACLAAAETIMQQQAITVSSAFAARLEILMRTYARSLVAQQNKVIAFPYSQPQIRIRQRTENKH